MLGALKSILAVLFLLSTGVAHVQAYPTKPVRMVIHIGPGSSMDIVGRVLAQKLNETGQPVIVDNRAGAGGTIGMDTVAKAAPEFKTYFRHDMEKWRRVVTAAGVSGD
jgi:tripartite-type tricarboxylate transporter receptor subunit TctC